MQEMHINFSKDSNMILEEIDEEYVNEELKKDLIKIVKKFILDKYGRNLLQNNIEYSVMIRHKGE